MKRLIVWTLCVVSILALSATAYAQVQFKASGNIDAQTYWTRNTPESGNLSGLFYGEPSGKFAPTGNNTFDRNQSWWNSRTRLKFDMVAGKELSGTILFEMDSSQWGDTDGTRNKYGFLDADRAAVEIKNIFVDFGVPYFGIPAPMTMRVGLQPFSLRADIVQDCDATGITLNIKADPVTIIPMYFKGFEGNNSTSDDLDYYGVEAKMNIDKLTIGGYTLFMNAQSYPTSQSGALAYGKGSDYKARMGWYGIYADGKVGPFDIKADLATDQGKVYARSSVSDPDVKMSGWVGRLTAAYPIDKFTIQGTFMYATGADADKITKDGFSKNGGTQNESYSIPIGAGGNWSDNLAIFYSTQLMHSGVRTTIDSTTNMARGWLGGTWAAQIRGSYPVMPWYKATAGVMYIGDTTRHGNTVGNARKGDKVSLRDDDYIGVELALLNEFSIYKNLKFNVILGYIVAGSAYDFWDGTKNVSPKDPYLVGTRLIYSF